MIPLQLMMTEFPLNYGKKVISPHHTSAVKSDVPYFLAIIDSWEVPFIGTSALEALEQHVVDVISQRASYGPYCSIVQSSGMGKSRLLDEFSKTNFVIPINIRNEDTTGMYHSFLPSCTVTPMFLGFPPPDNAIRDLLTRGDSTDIVRPRMLNFLSALFKRTKWIITSELQGAQTQSERITKFREFMIEGRTRTYVGSKREHFYKEVIHDGENVSWIYTIKLHILTFHRVIQKQLV